MLKFYLVRSMSEYNLVACDATPRPALSRIAPRAMVETAAWVVARVELLDTATKSEKNLGGAEQKNRGFFIFS